MGFTIEKVKRANTDMKPQNIREENTLGFNSLVIVNIAVGQNSPSFIR